MDEISLLSRSRNDIPERTPEDIARGRATLFAAIDDEAGFVASPVPRRRRRATWAGLSAVGAAGLTVTLVAVNVLGGPGAGETDAAAAAVLASAAEATLEFSDPVVAPGQYLLVRTEGVFATIGDIGGGDTSVLESYHDELFMPADRNDDWFWIQCERAPVHTFGPDSEAFAQVIAEEHEMYDSDIFRIFPAGITPGGGKFSGYGANGVTPTDDYDALPHEPEQLLDAIYALNGDAGQSRDGQALVWIADTLRRGTVPAEFRAALYEAAALIPGVTITEQQATLNGSTGIAIGRFEAASNTRQDIIINPATGQFIGEREVTVNGYADLPAGTATASTAVVTTVVDAAPSDVSTCTGP